MEQYSSVIIPTKNRRTSLERILACLERQTSKEFEVIVLDDNSEDETGRFCRQYLASSSFPFMYVHFGRKGYNVGRLRNIGAKIASADTLIFLDDDIVLTDNFIVEHQAHIKSQPDNVTIGKLLYVSTDYARGITPMMVRTGGHLVVEAGVISLVDPRESSLASLPLHKKAWGGNLGMKKSTFCKINGCDEEFDSWGGIDEDLGLRLERAGHHLNLVKDCLGYHMGADFLPMEKIMQQPGVRLFEDIKQHDTSLIRNTSPDRTSHMVTVCYSTAHYPTQLHAQKDLS